ncbi:hypothetical protein WP50_01645, partial [Lactiplantibacillus plantarum]
MKRLWLLLGGLVIGGGLLTGCQSKSTTAESHKVNIVATTNFYGSVAKAVGGKHVSVTSIINKPSVDPHDFEPTKGSGNCETFVAITRWTCYW